MTNRPYQDEGIAALRRSYATGHRAPMFVLPTGGGKTHVFSCIAEGAAAKGKRVLVVAHRRELIRQASRKLTEVGVRHGIIAPGHIATDDGVQVGSVQTLGRRLDRIGAFDLIIIDECHHAVAGQWAKLIQAQPSARLLGVTASPQRLDGRGLGVQAGGCFDDMILGPSVADLIGMGFLTPSRVFAPADGPDLSSVRTKGGDYDMDGLRAVMDVPTLTGEATTHYAKFAPGQPAIAFCASVEHARHVAATFQEAGWRATAADGSTPMAQRDAAIGGLATGAVQVLCVADLVSEGLDIPAVGAVILLRPTKSLGLFVQQIGRGLRPAPGKTHLTVLDHAANVLRHGLPDTPHEWSLEGRKGKLKPPPMQQCKSCFAITRPARVCPACGAAFAKPAKAAGEGREIEQVAGELAEVDAERLTRLRQTPLNVLMREASSRADLAEIARARGYKPGWVFKVSQERRERRGAEIAA